MEVFEMESISQLVSESLARNGMKPGFDHLRLEWSRWVRCESSFSVLLAPAKPGIFALGEEMISPADGSKRMLALFQVSETDDLGMTLGRLFLPGNPLGERLATGRCFTRYAVIEDRDQRATAYAIFERWMQDTSSGGMNVVKSQPSTSIALGMEVLDRETSERVRQRATLPFGF
jgi:hypothetical protein